jgi:hypothetical protein
MMDIIAAGIADGLDDGYHSGINQLSALNKEQEASFIG